MASAVEKDEVEKKEKEVSLTIDGIEVKGREGTSILDVAQRIGVYIPTLCYNEVLSTFGACRLCSVEIDTVHGRNKVVTSCNYPVEEGLVVKTKSNKVINVRRSLLDLLLSRCPKVTRLKNLAQTYGIEKPSLWVTDEEEDCILCGLCTRVCSELIGVSAINFANRGVEREVAAPYNDFSSDCIGCGGCAMVCPTGSKKIRIHTYATVSHLKGKKDADLGVCSDVFSGKSSIQGQDGGIATALLLSGFERGLFDAAIVVQRKNGYKAEAIIAVNPDDIIMAKGTKYLRIKMIPKLLELIENGKRKIAVVGVPCQVRAARKIQQVLGKDFPDLKITIIGLFCFEAFDYNKLKEETKRLLNVDLDKAEKTQIQKGKFIVQIGGQEKACRVKELDNAIDNGCPFCSDFTALFADVSVGSVGSESGFSTVIVRSEKGEKLCEKLDVIRGSVRKEAVAKLSNFKKTRARKNFEPLLRGIRAVRTGKKLVE
jgi:coenzyme F420-reducing hydrogenase beta subunit